RCGWPEDPGDQGRPRPHRPRPEGGEGPRRLGAEAGQGGYRPGRGRLDQGAARRGRRLGRAPVTRKRRPAAGLTPAAAGRPKSIRRGLYARGGPRYSSPGQTPGDRRMASLAVRGRRSLSWLVAPRRLVAT